MQYINLGLPQFEGKQTYWIKTNFRDFYMLAGDHDSVYKMAESAMQANEHIIYVRETISVIEYV